MMLGYNLLTEFTDNSFWSGEFTSIKYLQVGIP